MFCTCVCVGVRVRVGVCVGVFFVCRSCGLATVTAKASFTPDKISILLKPCLISGRKVSCFSAKICFTAVFRPKNPIGPIGKLGHRFFIHQTQLLSVCSLLLLLISLFVECHASYLIKTGSLLCVVYFLLLFRFVLQLDSGRWPAVFTRDISGSFHADERPSAF